MADSNIPTESAYDGGDPDPLARIGEIVGGRYRLLEFIGQGGMGNVYRGEHTTIRKPIALKLLHPSLASIPELRSRFEREAVAIGRIDHPNCVEVSDFGELADGSLFLAMEYLDGESAADLLDRERPLAAERALRIARHVLAGLSHAHRVGIVHRDIKPENIFLVTHHGDPSFAKVLDFGIAKILDAAAAEPNREKLTQAGISFGTPAYLSPEQAIGDPADQRSDLYSVAVVLYELLTGVPPFRAPDKMELLAMHANREAPPLSTAAPLRKFDPRVEAIIARGLTKRPSKRFQNADEFIAAIDSLAMFPRPPSASDSSAGAIATLVPSHVTPAAYAPTARALTQQSRAKPWPLIAVSAAAFAIIVGTVGFLASRSRILADIEQAEPSDVAIEADEHLKEGETEEAIELLTTERSAENDASAQLRLGHAYASRAEYDEAAEAYRRALSLDENAIRDVELINNLKIMIDGNGPIYMVALSLLVEYARDEKATALMIRLASSRNFARRKAAFALAEHLGFDERIDRVQAAIYDLAQEDTCNKRREAVVKLRVLGDPRAIKPLQEARVRLGKRPRKGRKRPNLNSCLSASARDAARVLKLRPGTDRPAE